MGSDVIREAAVLRPGRRGTCERTARRSRGATAPVQAKAVGGLDRGVVTEAVRVIRYQSLRAVQQVRELLLGWTWMLRASQEPS